MRAQAPVDLGAGSVTMGSRRSSGSQASDLSPETPTGLGQERVVSRGLGSAVGPGVQGEACYPHPGSGVGLARAGG